ncbi:MAG: carbonic anhydrase [Marinilabiliales bacterium]|nr:MAG: carbonic anhydrase [Marinilabiliales bacterium]
MPHLIPIEKITDIPAKYENTPIEKLLKYHNFRQQGKRYQKAEILLGMCMDNRKQLCLPDNFAYMIRNGGADMKYNEFKISYAIAVGGLSHMALIGHTDCAMVNLHERKDKFVDGLIRHGGWEKEVATKHFEEMAPQYEIHNEVEFTLKEAGRLQELYPSLTIVPMLFKLEDRKLYLIE